MKTGVIILAAGKGTRMKSAKPKVLHTLLDKAMVAYVLDAIKEVVNTKPVLVVGHGKDQVEAGLGDVVDYVWQKEQKGTGHGVMVSRQAMGDWDQVFVICGDTPLIERKTMEALLDDHLKNDRQATVLSVNMPNPQGYGRLVRAESGSLVCITEQKDASPREEAITEINSGMYVFQVPALLKALEKINPQNAQGEYYLTDVIGVMSAADQNVGSYLTDDPAEIGGINDRVQLAEASRILQEKIINHWLNQGVTMHNPSCVSIGADVILSEDVEIGPNVILEGHTSIGQGTIIRANSRLTDAKVGRYCQIDSSIVLESRMGDHCLIGPFAYIRPGSSLADRIKIGDFVEIKKSQVASGTKIPHHSYIGDAQVGENVNIGAGTITCNYDGVKKYITRIDDGVFIGSNSNLVAPVHIGKNAYVAAGSTITLDVSEGALSVARGRQKNIIGWRIKKGM